MKIALQTKLALFENMIAVLFNYEFSVFNAFIFLFSFTILQFSTDYCLTCKKKIPKKIT